MADLYDVQTSGIGGRNLPVWAAGVPHPVATLVNTGTVTLYVDQSPTAGTFGQPLSAGSTLLWDADRPLYAWTASGAGELLVADNTGLGFDAGAIAAQLNAQGLPLAIAQQINLAGVPAIDVPTSLLSATGTASGTAYTSPLINASRYQSLFLSWSDQPVGGYGGTDYRNITVTWYADSLQQILVDTANYFVSSTGPALPAVTSNLSGTLRVRAPYFTVGFSQVARNCTTALNVLGSYRPIQDDKLWLSNTVTNTNALGYLTASDDRTMLFGATTGGSPLTYTFWPAYQPGTYMVYTTASNAFDFKVFHILNNVAEMAKISIPGGNAANISELTLPQSQVQFSALIPASTTYRIALIRKP